MNYSFMTDWHNSSIDLRGHVVLPSAGWDKFFQVYPLLNLPTGTWCAILTACVGLFILVGLIPTHSASDLPVVNRNFAWEPSILARWRWAFGSREILAGAAEKYASRAYVLARGDQDITILPERFTKELNSQPKHIIESREAHNLNLLGDMTGVNIVTRTDRHVKNLLSRVSPQLNQLQRPASDYIETAVNEQFNSVGDGWTEVKILKKLVSSVTPPLLLVVFGAPLCDDPEFIRLCTVCSKNIFTIVFILRFIPDCLHPFLVWLLPFKWSLGSSFKQLQSIVLPEIVRRQNEEGEDHTNLLSSMIHTAKTPQESDPEELLRVALAVSSGANFSLGTLIAHFLFDVLDHPNFLGELRKEVIDERFQSDGELDMTSLNRLSKLDSALKETTRLSPASSTVYVRRMAGDYVLSNGLKLAKGTYVAMRFEDRMLNPETYPEPLKYDPKRSYNKELRTHISDPFSNTSSESFTWGSGRWACPGRFLANMMVKTTTVKLLERYEFRFTDGRRPPESRVHEFNYVDPRVGLMMKRRAAGDETES